MSARLPKRNPGRSFPQFYEKIIPVALIVILIAVVVILTIVVGIASGLLNWL